MRQELHQIARPAPTPWSRSARCGRLEVATAAANGPWKTSQPAAEVASPAFSRGQSQVQTERLENAVPWRICRETTGAQVMGRLPAIARSAINASTIGNAPARRSRGEDDSHGLINGDIGKIMQIFVQRQMAANATPSVVRQPREDRDAGRPSARRAVRPSTVGRIPRLMPWCSRSREPVGLHATVRAIGQSHEFTVDVCDADCQRHPMRPTANPLRMSELRVGSMERRKVSGRPRRR